MSSVVPSPIKIATGTYILQSKRAAFNSYKVDPKCRLCSQKEETVIHFLITCNALQNERRALSEDITYRCRELLDSININIDIARVIANPYLDTIT